MNIVVFGANGPTGLELCRQAIAEGHRITAAVRRPDEFPIRNNALHVVKANVMDGSSLSPVIENADAVLSALGAAYSRHEIQIYSVATKAMVEAMRASDRCRRLVVVSAGLAALGSNTPKVRGIHPGQHCIAFFAECYWQDALRRYVADGGLSRNLR